VRQPGPANCIYIQAEENTAAHRISAAERYAKVYNIDYNRCILYGYCVEACPTDAITHSHGFELAISGLIYRKEHDYYDRPRLAGVEEMPTIDEVVRQNGINDKTDKSKQHSAASFTEGEVTGKPL
jgi:formate hydrogenlyase subunit 6/NADH:ubiquinone oxidoreductase subunit I